MSLSSSGGALRRVVRVASFPNLAIGRDAYARWLYMTSGLLLMALLFSGPARAADPLAGVTDSATVLAKIQMAALHLNYTGTFIYLENDQTQASRITHLADASGEHEKLEILDGKVREFIRENNDVRCYIPDTKTILVEPRAKSDNFPALLATPAPDSDAHYEMSRGPIERVAGRNCNVIALKPRDNLRYGYRLWADQETGLLLKAETLDEHGKILDQVSFTDVQIGGNIDKAKIRPSATSTEGWRVEKFEATPANLAASGWVVNAQIPGFRKIMEVTRPFAGNREVGQIVFSDGLAAISVFVESASVAGQSEGEANTGPLNIARKKSGDHWLTVVGEAPAATIHQMIESVQFKSAAAPAK